MRVNHRSVSHPTAGSSHVLLLTFAGLFATQTLLPALPLFGQADSRVAEIEKERQERSAHLEADRRSKFEQKLVDIEQTKLLERLLGGVHGFQAKIGGLVSGSGFAIGPEYLREDLFSGNLTFRTSAEASYKLYQKYELQMTLPKLAANRMFADFYSSHRNYPRINFYGLGPRSAKGQRSDYRLEDTGADGIIGVRPVRVLKLGGSAGYLWVNVGPGTDPRLISTEKEFSPEQAPGIDRQTNFFRYSGFAQVDYRDDPRGPKSGGNYVAQYTWYQDRRLRLHDFRRFDVDLQHQSDRRVSLGGIQRSGHGVVGRWRQGILEAQPTELFQPGSLLRLWLAIQCSRPNLHPSGCRFQPGRVSDLVQIQRCLRATPDWDTKRTTYSMRWKS